MDIFGDKGYEELDWLTKTVEPITWTAVDKLNSMPDECVFNIFDIKSVVRESGSSLPGMALFDLFVGKNGIKFKDWDERDELRKCYRLNLSDGVEVNFITDEIIGEIKLVKFQSSFTEDYVKAQLGRLGTSELYSAFLNKQQNMDRVNEILDLMDSDEGLRKRTTGNKISVLINSYTKIMKDLKWNIRDVELSNKVSKWIIEYVHDGNLAAFANLCKLKAITHRGYPIYSIEEEV